MPKISSQYIHLQHDDLPVTITFDVMYNSEYKFYVFIPYEYQQAFDLLTDKDLNRLKGMGWSKSKHGQKTHSVVADISEAACIKSYEEMIKHLMTATLKKRDVIIVYYTGSDKGNNSEWLNEVYNERIKFEPELIYKLTLTS